MRYIKNEMLKVQKIVNDRDKFPLPETILFSFFRFYFLSFQFIPLQRETSCRLELSLVIELPIAHNDH